MYPIFYLLEGDYMGLYRHMRTAVVRQAWCWMPEALRPYTPESTSCDLKHKLPTTLGSPVYYGALQYIVVYYGV